MIDCNEWKTEKCHECANMGESKMTRIVITTVPHVTSGSGLRKFQADGFLFDRAYIDPLVPELNAKCDLQQTGVSVSAALRQAITGRCQHLMFGILNITFPNMLYVC